MLFSKETFVGKKIPKQRFYENIDLKKTLKKKFIDYIDSITFLHKLSKNTINIPKTNEIEEIFVFEVELKSEEFISKIEDLLEIIDRSIPYPILFEFKLCGKRIYKIAHKSRNQNDPNKSVIDTYLTYQVKEEDIPKLRKELKESLNSINLQVLYDKIMSILIQNKSDDIKGAVQDYKRKMYLIGEIERLNGMILREKQADKQYGLHAELKKMQEELKEYE